jgi:hypothetical protein
MFGLCIRSQLTQVALSPAASFFGTAASSSPSVKMSHPSAQTSNTTTFQHHSQAEPSSALFPQSTPQRQDTSLHSVQATHIPAQQPMFSLQPQHPPQSMQVPMQRQMQQQPLQAPHGSVQQPVQPMGFHQAQAAYVQPPVVTAQLQPLQAQSFMGAPPMTHTTQFQGMSMSSSTQAPLQPQRLSVSDPQAAVPRNSLYAASSQPPALQHSSSTVSFQMLQGADTNHRESGTPMWLQQSLQSFASQPSQPHPPASSATQGSKASIDLKDIFG